LRGSLITQGWADKNDFITIRRSQCDTQITKITMSELKSNSANTLKVLANERGGRTTNGESQRYCIKILNDDRRSIKICQFALRLSLEDLG